MYADVADVYWYILCKDRKSSVEAQEYLLREAMNSKIKHKKPIQLVSLRQWAILAF